MIRSSRVWELGSQRYRPPQSAFRSRAQPQVRFWCGADMNCKARLAGSVENDPTADLEKGLFWCRSSVRRLSVSQAPYKHRLRTKEARAERGLLSNLFRQSRKNNIGLQIAGHKAVVPRPGTSPQFALLFFVTWFLSATILPRLLPGAGGTKYAVPLLRKIPTPCPAIP